LYALFSSLTAAFTVTHFLEISVCHESLQEQLSSRQGDDEATVTLTFSITGMFGLLLTMFSPKAVVGGTEGGLAHVVKLSEEASNKLTLFSV
jgi:hypothetical protein